MTQVDLLEWFDVHYQPSSFHGRFQIGYRKKNETALLPLVTHEREALGLFLADMFLKPDYDYYITANAVSGVRRKTQGLFSYHNIVIDLDNHGAAAEDYFLQEELIWRLERDRELPAPTSLVKTGRGIQLWWTINPVHVKCKSYFNQVRDAFMEEIQEILEEYPSLSCFSLDKTASCNDVGYYRLPCSYNTKVQKKVQVAQNPCASYRLQDLVDSVAQWTEKKAEEQGSLQGEQDELFRHDFASHEIFVLKNVQTLAFFRVKQLILLRKSRDSNVMEETRNNLNFLLYNSLLPALGHALAWEKLLAFNSGFKRPMSQVELEAVIVSAKEKGGYKYTNRKIIEFLSITPEEQEKIGLFSSKTPQKQDAVHWSQHPSRDASRALAKECRDQKIHQLANSGLTQKAIATQLGISAATVSKILKAKTCKIQQQSLAKQALMQGKTIAEAVVISGLSRSTIKRILAVN